MNPLLNPKVQEFIRKHENADETTLLLTKKLIHGVSATLVAQQIIGRKKVKQKIKDYFQTTGILYPPSLNIEQSSSQATAKFKASTFAGKNMIDLTGGFGVDSFFLSKSFDQVIYLEPNKVLLELTAHNHKLLHALNIQHLNTTAEEFLKSHVNPCDLIYLDPSRRDNLKGRVFKFSDCQPNLLALLPTLSKLSSQLLVKASPLHDIKQGIKELKCVSKVFILSVDNECKELLFHLSKEADSEIGIEAVNLDGEGKIKHRFEFNQIEEQEAIAEIAAPQTYLYEPNASIMKAGAFNLIARRFEVSKLSANTHLYTSSKFVTNFPGKSFRIDAHLKSDSKSVNTLLPERKANITTRNYPISTAALKKKLKLTDGGDRFIIGCSGTKTKYLLLATKL